MPAVDCPEIDYELLLLAHVACADKQLHAHESAYLHDRQRERKSTDLTREQIALIEADSPQGIGFQEVLARIPLWQQESALRHTVHMVYADGHADPREDEMIKQIARTWGVASGRVQDMVAQAASRAVAVIPPEHVELDDSELLIMAMDMLFGRGFLDDAIATTTSEQQIMAHRFRKEMLLASPQQWKAIERCSRVAEEDMVLAEDCLKRSLQALTKLLNQLKAPVIANKQNRNGLRQSERQVESVLDELREDIAAVIRRDLERVFESLCSKKRALRYFTIAFIGRTKAGKSTLHAVITSQGREGIGNGGQRTTRFNRIYELHNLKIIDTPGIGAPGGATDAEIAASVVDEADLVCFVVTNDAQHEAEFAFMRQLKAKAKPLVILLNVLGNLDKVERVERFLRRGGILSQSKPEDLQNHCNRIRRYARSHYENDLFEIFPVHLQAALMSDDNANTSRQSRLLTLSRLPEFLEHLRNSIVRDGTIRRSQTLLGSSVCDLEQASAFLKGRANSCRELVARLQRKHSSFKSRIAKASSDSRRELSSKVRHVFSKVRDGIPDFAERHWDASSDSISADWRDHLSLFRLEERLRQTAETVIADFLREVRDELEEIGREFETLSSIPCTGFHLKVDQGDFSYRNLFRIGGSVLGVVALFFPPSLVAGIVIGAAGIILGVAAQLFQSKQERIRKAAEKIREQLEKQIGELEKTTLARSEEWFDQEAENLENGVDEYLGLLAERLNNVVVCLANGRKAITDSVENLNLAYAERIIQWLRGPDAQPSHDSIRAVVREAGKSIEIKLKKEIWHNREEAEIEHVLQEKLRLTSEAENTHRHGEL